MKKKKKDFMSQEMAECSFHPHISPYQMICQKPKKIILPLETEYAKFNM